MSRYRSFSTEVEAFAQLSKRRLNTVFTEVAQNMLRHVHESSTYNIDTGWSRASWILSVGAKAEGVYSYKTGWFTAHSTTWRDNKPPRGAKVSPPDPVKQTLKNVTLQDRIYLTNNVFYIGKLEEQVGMLAATAAFGRREITRIARSLNK